MKGPIAIAADQAAGRLATGDITRSPFEIVAVRCYYCGGVTNFSVLVGCPRPWPAPCHHCGEGI